MKRIIKVVLVLVAFSELTGCNNRNTQSDNCFCNTTEFLQSLRVSDFNKIHQYDTVTFSPNNLYGISAEENRRLWYRDIQNPDTTKFTKYWNDYVPTNYHADHLDFVKYYKDNPETEIAFQFGPNGDLWAYHIFVIRKIDCCYLATRSYFRHARFTYKAYAVMNKAQVDSLFKVLEPINKIPIDTVSTWNYRGYFSDNRNKTQFYVDFEKEVEVADSVMDFPTPKREIRNLYDFVDKGIKWKDTYK
jgi:hypothetical protein